MNCSMPGLPVRHHLPEFTQAHVHRVLDAIQPSHPQSAGVQAPVDPGNSKVGTTLVLLEKYIFNYRDIERLETDTVVGKLVEKKRLNNLVYVE